MDCGHPQWTPGYLWDVSSCSFSSPSPRHDGFDTQSSVLGGSSRVPLTSTGYSSGITNVPKPPSQNSAWSTRTFASFQTQNLPWKGKNVVRGRPGSALSCEDAGEGKHEAGGDGGQGWAMSLSPNTTRWHRWRWQCPKEPLRPPGPAGCEQSRPSGLSLVSVPYQMRAGWSFSVLTPAILPLSFPLPAR